MQIWILLVFTCLIVLGFLIYYQNNPVKTGGSEKSHVIKPKGFVIAHLAGLSGVGKTYQAEKLAKEYKDIVFADLDEILEKVPKTKKGFPLNAKSAIENFIASRTNIILVGYNDYTIENIHYWIDIPTVNRFFLEDDKDSILKRRVDRFKKLKKTDPTVKQVMSWLEEMKNDENLYEEKLYRFLKLDKLSEEIDYQVKMYRKKQELISGAWNPVIIHVTGPPGSGKTTLMNSLKNTLTNSDVYDSDTIFYEQIRYIMKKYPNLYKEFIAGKNDKFWNKVWLDGYQERFFKLVDKAVTAKHNIIILGITIELALIADCKYIIDLAPEENFRRRNLREVKKICDNRANVEALLKNAKLPDAVYKIFMDYDHHGAVIGAPNKEIKSMNEIRKVSQDRGYKLLPTTDIEHAIKQTLQPEELTWVALKKRIEREKPRTISLVGRGGVGKSYTSDLLIELGYRHIPIDEEIRKMTKTHPVGNKLFDIYSKPNDYDVEAKQLVDKLRSARGKIVYDGMLLPKDVAALEPDMLVYVEPADWKIYRQSLSERLENDIAKELNTLGIVWRFIKDRKNLTDAIKKTALDQAVEYQKIRNAEVKNDYLPLQPIILKNRN